LRDIGAGIYLWENVIRVLEALEVYHLLTPTLHEVPRFEVRDERRKLVQCMDFSSPEGPRCNNVLRPELHKALAGTARDLGVEIVTGAAVRRATPNGELITENGEHHSADLVIAADGVNSTIRDGLRLLKYRKELPDGAHRLLVPRPASERDDPEKRVSYEYWAGPRRIIYSPCAPDWIYIALSTRADDHSGAVLPVDVDSWRASFPHMSTFLDRIDEHTTVRWDRFTKLGLHKWSSGHVAVLGDAAYAQPPNLGQGAGLAMSNALGLAVALEQEPTVEHALRVWEARERPLVEHTQRWSTWWGLTSTVPCPTRLQPTRAKLVGALARNKWIEERLSRTARHRATGTR
jgi:2-polyprenyl-6-methoxyphenol hydroxylase-like FAD-dependent oxidoreductase